MTQEIKQQEQERQEIFPKEMLNQLIELLSKIQQFGDFAIESSANDGNVFLHKDILVFCQHHQIMPEVLLERLGGLFQAPAEDLSPVLKKLNELLATVNCGWKTGPLTVNYHPFFDAGGTDHAGPIGKYLQSRFTNREFKRGCEAFSGPGFIGFHMLALGLVQSMDFMDINSQVIKRVQGTIIQNQLADKCVARVSDNFTDIPAGERYDIIVGNPPWSFQFQNDDNVLIANDPDWKIHSQFYQQVREHLNPEGIVVLLEWKPFETEPTAPWSDPEKPWDIRLKPPHEEFLTMIHEGGLSHVDTVQLPGGWPGLHLVIAQNN